MNLLQIFSACSDQGVLNERCQIKESAEVCVLSSLLTCLLMLCRYLCSLEQQYWCLLLLITYRSLGAPLQYRHACMSKTRSVYVGVG